MHVTLPSQCVCAYLGRSFAMCLLKPSSLPQCLFPMCLRNASSPIQCVFAMHLRHPMRLHNASAPPKASAPSNASSPVRLRRLDLFLTNASSQRGCVFRSSATLRQDAAVYVYTYIYMYMQFQLSQQTSEQSLQPKKQSLKLNTLNYSKASPLETQAHLGLEY